jgi:hypothetical protein
VESTWFRRLVISWCGTGTHEEDYVRLDDATFDSLLRTYSAGGDHERREVGAWEVHLHAAFSIVSAARRVRPDRPLTSPSGFVRGRLRNHSQLNIQPPSTAIAPHRNTTRSPQSATHNSSTASRARPPQPESGRRPDHSKTERPEQPEQPERRHHTHLPVRSDSFASPSQIGFSPANSAWKSSLLCA